jgi:hypothetical protein
VLKKAGLIVAASAASIVALSPLAFATDEPTPPGNQNSSGAVNGLNGNNLDAPIEACNNDVQGQAGLVPVQDVAENPTLPPLNGAAGLLGGEGKAHQDSDSTNARTCGQDPAGAGYGNN